MKNSKALFEDFVNRITLVETRDEIKSMAYLVFENIFGLTKAEIMTGKEVDLPLTMGKKLDEIIGRVNEHEPVQYILGDCFFYGRRFSVSPAVLIPRPETEELVRFVINSVQKDRSINRVLDIGTGSGCIAVTLALELPGVETFATDISSGALGIASKNSRDLNANVKFIQHDVLKDKLPVSIDVIVSNPPYIAWNERKLMARNVTEYEPELALFVDSNDPLVFYKAIVSKAKESLTPKGLIAVEINERFGREVHLLFVESGLTDVQVIQDVLGKDRIVKGVLSS